MFTSYAPVVNPRLAVVVITRGTDAHNHLPAAVAGNVYRALSPRFGTNINLQVAEGPDDETPTRDKKAAALDEEAKENKAATEAEEKADDDAAATDAAKAAAKDDSGNKDAAADSKSKVKATSMPLPVDNKPKTTKPATTGTKPTTPATQVKPNANETNDGRPRRIQPN